MLVLTRWYYGKSGSVLDTDDMSDEHVMKEQLHEAKMQGLVFENLSNCVYSEKFGKIVFFFRWQEHEKYGTLYVYDVDAGKMLDMKTIELRFTYPKGCKRKAYIMDIDYFRISYWNDTVTIFLYDKHFYEEDCGTEFALEIPYKNGKFYKPKKDSFTIFRR